MKNKKIFTAQDVEKVFINPFYTINISPELCLEHETMVDRLQWVKVNVKLVEEIGLEQWLYQLLAVLEGDYATSQ